MQMKYIAKSMLVFVGLLLAFSLAAFAAEGTDFVVYRWFAPRKEQLRREVFEQSKAYREGMQQEIQSMAFQYQVADAAHRDALASMILHRVADYDVDQLSSDLRAFVAQLRSERLGGAR